MWEANGREANEKGIEMHRKITAVLQDGENHLEASINAGLQFFLRNYVQIQVGGIKFVEERVFDSDLRLAGTIDFAFQNEDGVYCLVDWKRSAKGVDQSFRCFRRPLSGCQQTCPPNTHCS